METVAQWAWRTGATRCEGRWRFVEEACQDSRIEVGVIEAELLLNYKETYTGMFEINPIQGFRYR
jgi:hypothetical protein